LLDLRESHKLVWRRKGGTFKISVGDVVIIHEEKQPRSNWCLGKVEGIIRGKDGHIRGASLRHSITERPLQERFPLEIDTNEILEPKEYRK